MDARDAGRRSYACFRGGDLEALEEDLNEIRETFLAGGPACPRHEVAAVFRAPDRLLVVMSLDTDTLCRMYSEAQVREGGGVKPDAALAPGGGGSVGEWDESIGGFGASTLLRVLCHRRDRVASKFLKTAARLPKGDEGAMMTLANASCFDSIERLRPRVHVLRRRRRERQREKGEVTATDSIAENSAGTCTCTCDKNNWYPASRTSLWKRRCLRRARLVRRRAMAAAAAKARGLEAYAKGDYASAAYRFGEAISASTDADPGKHTMVTSTTDAPRDCIFEDVETRDSGRGASRRARPDVGEKVVSPR